MDPKHFDLETARALVDIARRAGDAILAVYRRDDFAVEQKADNSPVTEADLAANAVIVKALTDLFPDIPVFSEESRAVPYDERRDWPAFWLVDPLDGTKEFIRRNDEFTVNIALIVGEEPVAGVVHLPAANRTYWGARGLGAFRVDDAGEAAIAVRGEVDVPVIVASRSHRQPEDDAFAARLEARYGQVETRRAGSSLKICLVAEGSADVYPRFGPTSEWDIAAAQAVLEQAGGVIERLDGTALSYNKPDVLNPHFIAHSGAFAADLLHGS